MEQTPRDMGTLAELRFAYEAHKQGFTVCNPLQENQPYDYILEKHGSFSRVQIKSCNVPIAKDGSFKFTISFGCEGKSPYTSKHIEHIACYSSQLDIFYIIPVILLEELKTIRLYPYKENARYNEFKENWDIFKQ